MTRKTVLASCFLALAACGCCRGGNHGPVRPDWVDRDVAEREARSVFASYCKAIVDQDVEAMFALLSSGRRAEFLREFGSFESFAAEARRTWMRQYRSLADGAQVIRCIGPLLSDPTVDLTILMGDGSQQNFRLVREGADWRVSQGWRDIRETVR
ncbi:MAG: hypothetical protein HY608_05680 [Planctomycetes bacterium]|nr:hypothetical protein [Planctomycetota bacterium]